MLAWPHSGFHVHDGVWVAADDREFAVRLARYCARNPVALSRLEYWSDDATLTYHSDKPTGPTAGSETVDVLEFLARVMSHIPNKGSLPSSRHLGIISRASTIRTHVDKSTTRSARSSNISAGPAQLVRRWGISARWVTHCSGPASICCTEVSIGSEVSLWQIAVRFGRS